MLPQISVTSTQQKLLIFFSIILSRITILTDSNINIDGDESIVGLMAKHFWLGQEFPIFFYGQSYGFSFLEVVPIALMYQLFGVSIVSVKLGMLLLWTIGIFFFYGTLKNVSNNKNSLLPLLITILLIISPVFLLWSMKARGGYLTAFCLANVVLYLTTKEQKSIWIPSILIGALCVLIYQSQPLWIPGLIPFIGISVYQRKSWKSLAAVVASAFLTSVTFYLIKLGLPEFGSPSVFRWDNFSWNFLTDLYHSMYIYWQGAYEYFEISDVPFLTPFLAQFLNLTTIILLVTGLVGLILRKKMPIYFWVSWLAVCANLSYTPLIPLEVYRYLLPLSGYAMMLLFVALDQLNFKKLIYSILTLVIIMSMVNAWQFKQVEFPFWKSKKQLVTTLLQNNISHVYCQDGLEQWQLMFLSNEQIIARFIYDTDRYQPYVDSVDKAYVLHPSNTAWAGFHNPYLPMDSEQTIKIEGGYFIYTMPSKQYLLKMGFQLKENVISHNKSNSDLKND